MGIQFIGNHGGPGVLYGCKQCKSCITTSHELSSRHFNGSTGPAMLFRQAWNVEHGKVERRKMTTGWHIVRDVFCVLCKAKLGWMYEMAMEHDQMYKEGQVILENALIQRIAENQPDPLKDDDAYRVPSIERPRIRTPSETSSTASRFSRSNSESSYSSLV